MPFHFEQTVRVHHCDPAGGVFYPRYFEMLTICTEEWLLAVPGLRLSEMASSHGLLAPTLGISAEFHQPCRLGERLIWRVTPQHLGKSSCRVGYHLFAGDELRASFVQTLVLIGAADKRPTPWPDDLRQRIMAEMPVAA